MSEWQENGWVIINPWGRSIGIFERNRVHAIAEACRRYDQPSYDDDVDDAKRGRVWHDPEKLTPNMKRAWAGMRRKGYRAVRAVALPAPPAQQEEE